MDRPHDPRHLHKKKPSTPEVRRKSSGAAAGLEKFRKGGGKVILGAKLLAGVDGDEVDTNVVSEEHAAEFGILDAMDELGETDSVVEQQEALDEEQQEEEPDVVDLDLVNTTQPEAERIHWKKPRAVANIMKMIGLGGDEKIAHKSGEADVEGEGALEMHEAAGVPADEEQVPAQQDEDGPWFGGGMDDEQDDVTGFDRGFDGGEDGHVGGTMGSEQGGEEGGGTRLEGGDGGHVGGTMGFDGGEDGHVGGTMGAEQGPTQHVPPAEGDVVHVEEVVVEGVHSSSRPLETETLCSASEGSEPSILSEAGSEPSTRRMSTVEVDPTTTYSYNREQELMADIATLLGETVSEQSDVIHFFTQEDEFDEDEDDHEWGPDGSWRFETRNVLSSSSSGPVFEDGVVVGPPTRVVSRGPLREGSHQMDSFFPSPEDSFFPAAEEERGSFFPSHEEPSFFPSHEEPSFFPSQDEEPSFFPSHDEEPSFSPAAEEEAPAPVEIVSKSSPPPSPSPSYATTSNPVDVTSARGDIISARGDYSAREISTTASDNSPMGGGSAAARKDFGVML